MSKKTNPTRQSFKS